MNNLKMKNSKELIKKYKELNLLISLLGILLLSAETSSKFSFVWGTSGLISAGTKGFITNMSDLTTYYLIVKMSLPVLFLG